MHEAIVEKGRDGADDVVRSLRLSEAIVVLADRGIGIAAAYHERPSWEIATLLDEAIARAYVIEMQQSGGSMPGPLIGPDETPDYIAQLPEVSE